MKTQKTILVVALVLTAITTSCRNSLYDDLPSEQDFNTKEYTQQKVTDTLIILPPNTTPHTTQSTMPPLDTIRTGSFRINNTNNNN